MKPCRFTYVAPSSLDETVQALTSWGADACKLLAGGQSLGPLLNLRLSNPEVVIDLDGVKELGGTPTCDDFGISLPAMSRQRSIELNRTVAEVCPLITQALPFVAHRTIRNRGTIGGSLAHSDPAAELPAVALANNAEFVAFGPHGERRIPASEFFQGYFTTALAADEILWSIGFARQVNGMGSAWVEFAPRHGDFAIVGVAAELKIDGAGVIESARLAYSGIADTPWRNNQVDDTLVGERARVGVYRAAARIASTSCHPPADLVGTTAYRQHLVRVLTVEALALATTRARAHK